MINNMPKATTVPYTCTWPVWSRPIAEPMLRKNQPARSTMPSTILRSIQSAIPAKMR